MAVEAVLFAVGAGAQFFGQMSAANDREAAAQKMRDLKREQASEILSRSKINIERIKRSGREFVATQEAAIASSGLGQSASSLLLLEDTYSKIAEAVSDAEREAKFKAKQLRKGADIQLELESDAADAQRFGAFGGLVMNSAQFSYASGKRSGGGTDSHMFLNYGGGGQTTTGGSPVFGFQY